MLRRSLNLRAQLLILTVTYLIVTCFRYQLLHFREVQDILENQRSRLRRLLDLGPIDIIIEDESSASLQKEQEPEIKMTENEVTLKYAYSSLMAGCDPNDKKYLGFMFNAIVSFEILRANGSTADFILMVRMAPGTTMESLPKEEEESMRKAGIKFMYLPKPLSTDEDNYLTAQMDKFHFLSLSNQYSKVIFMDADVMPLCNLDMFFKASNLGLIEQNLVLSERCTPANGGFFMLSLNDGDYEKAYDIIKNKKTPFDREIGWGQKIEHPDYYRVKYDAEPRYGWNFNASPADQGFLYYWVKYIKKSVTINVNSDVGLFEDWSASPNGIVLQTHNGFKNIPSCPSAVKGSTPWFHHFYSFMKPWLHVSDKIISKRKKVNRFDEVTSLEEMWWYYLLKANKIYGLNLKIDVVKGTDVYTSLPLGAWTNKNAKLVNNENVKLRPSIILNNAIL